MSMRTYSIRVEQEQMERWAELAAVERVSLSEWIREAALRREADDTKALGVQVRARRGRAVQALLQELQEIEG